MAEAWRALAAELTARTGRDFAAAPAEAVHGGSIHRCLRWPGRQGDAFVKVGDAACLPAFEAEAEGLAALRDAAALRVPATLALAVVDDHAVLALEWLDLARDTPASAQARLGRGLAALHRVTAPRFGWDRDNVIGATPQPNARDDDWTRFYRVQRLGHQLDLAAARGLDPRTVERGRRLVASCDALLAGHSPVPSLLHGDLWGGNWAVLARTGEPVVYDPATYYGDREADLSLTALFGGFGPGFHAAYGEAWPLPPGAATRRTLYALYHVLNHYVLFGGGYARQAAAMIDRLLAELG